MIKEGYNEKLDELKKMSLHGKDWIAEMQQKERERTGIKSLKVGYNSVFGYYIEVTKANLAQVPRNIFGSRQQPMESVTTRLNSKKKR